MGNWHEAENAEEKSVVKEQSMDGEAHYVEELFMFPSRGDCFYSYFEVSDATLDIDAEIDVLKNFDNWNYIDSTKESRDDVGDTLTAFAEHIEGNTILCWLCFEYKDQQYIVNIYGSSIESVKEQANSVWDNLKVR